MQCQNRDAILFQNLPLIRSLASHYFRGHDADDFCLELSLRLVRALQSGVYCPAAWLHIAARNLAITLHESRGVGAGATAEAHYPLPARSADPSDLASAAEVPKRVFVRLQDRPLGRELRPSLLARPRRSRSNLHPVPSCRQGSHAARVPPARRP